VRYPCVKPVGFPNHLLSPSLPAPSLSGPVTSGEGRLQVHFAQWGESVGGTKSPHWREAGRTRPSPTDTPTRERERDSGSVVVDQIRVSMGRPAAALARPLVRRMLYRQGGLGNRTGTRQRGPYSLPRTWTGARDFRRGGCGSRYGKPHVDFVDGRPDEVTRRSVGAAASSAERASANLPSASRIASDIAAALRPVA